MTIRTRSTSRYIKTDDNSWKRHLPQRDHNIGVFVKTWDGRTITVYVEPGNTIGEVKGRIARNVGLPSRNQQRLIFDGEQLEDRLTVSDCKIQNKSTLYLKKRVDLPATTGNELLAIGIVDKTGLWNGTLQEETMITIKKTHEMRNVFNIYAKRKFVNPTSLRFLFDRERVGPDDTPMTLRLEDKDQIECILSPNSTSKKLNNGIINLKERTGKKTPIRREETPCIRKIFVKTLAGMTIASPLM